MEDLGTVVVRTGNDQEICGRDGQSAPAALASQLADPIPDLFRRGQVVEVLLESLQVALLLLSFRTIPELQADHVAENSSTVFNDRSNSPSNRLVTLWT